MNLENLNLVELNIQDLQEIDGGSFWQDVAYAVGYGVGKLVYSYNHIEPQVYQRW